MRKQKDRQTLFALVTAESGIPVCVETFYDINKARRKEKYIKRTMNPENDETGIFEVLI